MVDRIKIDDQTRETHIRFRIIDDYEAYFIAIDQDYESGDAFFNGYFYKINTLQFKLVHRSQYCNGCDFKHEVIDYRGNTCFIPTKGFCFVNCIKFITDEDYQQQCLDIIRTEKRRPIIMTKARIQPFCRANKINLGYFDELFLLINHFCLIRISEGVSFNQAIRELKDNFKIDDSYKTEENVISHFKYEFIPKKIESHLTSFIIYDLETHNTDRARP